MADFVPTIPALDDILGGGFPAGRLTQIRSTRWAEVSGVVDALCSAAPGAAAPFDAGAILECADEHPVVYVRAPAMDPNTTTTETYRRVTSIMRRLCVKLDNRPSAVVLLSDVRERAGVVFGSPTDEGNALRFYTSLRIDLLPRPNGSVLVRTLKNKRAPPFRSVSFALTDGALAVVPAPTWEQADADARDAILQAVDQHGALTRGEAILRSAAEECYAQVVREGSVALSSAHAIFDKMVRKGALVPAGWSGVHELYQRAPSTPGAT